MPAVSRRKLRLCTCLLPSYYWPQPIEAVLVPDNDGHRKRVLPPVYLLFSLITIFLLHFLIPAGEIAAYPWNLLGLLPLLLGIALNLIADAAFKREQTTVKPFEQSSALVVTGVFRISRHPMYLGMVLILLGVAILLGSVTPLFIVAIFGVLLELVFVRAEERMLEEQFGATWLAYKKRVRKWC